MTQKENDSRALHDVIIEALQDRKGQEIVSLDLSNIEHSVADYFIVCHGTSKIQVDALADSVMDATIKELKSKPYHKEGFENAEWILLDYFDVVVHIFQEESRNFYQLEKLWADALIERFPESTDFPK